MFRSIQRTGNTESVTHMEPNMADGNGWTEYKQLMLDVKNRFETHCNEEREFRERVISEISSLKTRASVWGLVAGFVATSLVHLVVFLLK